MTEKLVIDRKDTTRPDWMVAHVDISDIKWPRASLWLKENCQCNWKRFRATTLDGEFDRDEEIQDLRNQLRARLTQLQGSGLDSDQDPCTESKWFQLDRDVDDLQDRTSYDFYVAFDDKSEAMRFKLSKARWEHGSEDGEI